jgi:TRAP-type mannitol/chloroaromatic compound transport system permease small subunit
MVLMGFYNALTRIIDEYWGTHLTSNAWVELQWYLWSAIFLLMVGYTLLHNGHVRVDVIYGRLSPRQKAWINMLGALLFVIPMSIIALYVSIPFVAGSIGWFAGGRWEVSPDPGGLIRWPVKFLILPGFVLLCLQAISEAIKNLAFLRGFIPAPEHEPIGEVA